MPGVRELLFKGKGMHMHISIGSPSALKTTVQRVVLGSCATTPQTSTACKANSCDPAARPAITGTPLLSSPAAHDLWLLLGNDCDSIWACRASGDRRRLHRAHHDELHSGRESVDRQWTLRRNTDTGSGWVSEELASPVAVLGKDDRVPMTGLQAPGPVQAGGQHVAAQAE